MLDRLIDNIEDLKRNIIPMCGEADCEDCPSSHICDNTYFHDLDEINSLLEFLTKEGDGY